MAAFFEQEKSVLRDYTLLIFFLDILSKNLYNKD